MTCDPFFCNAISSFFITTSQGSWFRTSIFSFHNSHLYRNTKQMSSFFFVLVFLTVDLFKPFAKRGRIKYVLKFYFAIAKSYRLKILWQIAVVRVRFNSKIAHCFSFLVSSCVVRVATLTTLLRLTLLVFHQRHRICTLQITIKVTWICISDYNIK